MPTNEFVFEGVVAEDPQLVSTEKFRLISILVEQKEVYKTYTKVNILSFKGFGIVIESVLEAKRGDQVKVIGKLTGSSYKDKSGKEWWRSENIIKSFSIEKKVEANVIESVFDKANKEIGPDFIPF